MKYSENYKLNKPDWDDQYNIDHWNENTDKIDERMRKNQDEIESNDKDIATLFDESSKTNADVAAINAKIPAQASATNQLADKNFVNSSIATNTAYFVGTFNSVSALNAYGGTKTNNDYAFVQTTDTAGNTIFQRYKWNGTAWLYEYELNNSSFTSAQWAAINSGATSGKIGQIKGMGGASAGADGSAGFVPQPKKGEQGNFLRGDGTWQALSSFVTLQAAFDAAHPVGDTYTQYPQQDDPETLFNKNGITSTWSVVDYGGAFFRAQGGNADGFKTKWDVLTKQSDQNKSHSHSVSGDTGNMSGNEEGTFNARLSDSISTPNVGDARSGNVSRSDAFTAYKCDSGDATLGVKYTINVQHTHNFSATTQISGSDEARPINYTIRVWKRTA